MALSGAKTFARPMKTPALQATPKGAHPASRGFSLAWLLTFNLRSRSRGFVSRVVGLNTNSATDKPRERLCRR